MRKSTSKRITTAALCAAVSVTMLGAGGTEAAEQTKQPSQEVKLPTPIKTIDLDGDVSDDAEYLVEQELMFDNPFGTEEIQKEVQEYGLYETPEYTSNKGVQRAVWKKGLTVSYWIKVPTGENGSYLPSGVLRWELDEELPQKDDYAKYLCSTNFDRLYQELSDEEKQAAKKEESKVPYGSDYYFKYLETEGMDEDGAPKAKEYSDEEVTGPVYDNRYFLNDYPIEEGESRVHASAYYACNPHYKRGFIKMADGTYQRQAKEYAEAYYNDYHTMDISAGSKVRRADVHGEFQIDVDNSVMWLPENGEGIEKNTNVDSYGKPSYMQKENCFYMNSWYNEKRTGDSEITSYHAVDAVAALSPVTSVTNGTAVKNGNCDKWHQVTVTLQNDKVGFYVDGQEVNVVDEYGINGYACLNTAASVEFSSFNKGGCLRDSLWGTMTDTDSSYLLNKGNMVCQLFMEWITNENAKLYIGGKGDYAGQYNLAPESNPFYLDDVNFYGELLTKDQIQALYQKEAVNRGETEESPKPTEPVTAKTVIGDVDGDGRIGLDDVRFIFYKSVKMYSPEIEAEYSKATGGKNISQEAFDLNGDTEITLQDVVLARDMVMNGYKNKEVPAKEITTIPEAKLDVVAKGDGYYECTVNVEGNLLYMDYGIRYDKEKVDFVSFDYDEEAKSFYEDGTKTRIVDEEKGYIVVGGVKLEASEADYSGRICTITFKAKDADTEIGIVRNCALADLDNFKAESSVKLSEAPKAVLYGDANADGIVDLQDAQIVLCKALKIKNEATVLASDDICDMDRSGAVELHDAQNVLSLALKIAE